MLVANGKVHPQYMLDMYARFIERFTIPRAHDLFHRCLPRHRRNCKIPRKCLYSSSDTPNVGSAGNKTQRSGSSIALVQDLLLGAAKEATSQKEEQITAALEPPLKTYLAHPQPAERWRERKRLGSSKKNNDGRSEATETAVRSALQGGEITFREHHKALLRPPDQDKFEEQRRAAYVGHIMRSYLQVLTTPTADTPGTALLLHFDSKRYLIGNLAEGTQRASVQMGARLLKVNECFITGRTEWRNTGGLLGMILTLADAASSSAAASQEEANRRAVSKGRRLGVLEDEEKMSQFREEAKKETSSSLTLFGGPNLNYTLATARRFVFRKGMPVDVHEIDPVSSAQGPAEDEWAPYWADENLKMWAMAISPSSSPASNGYVPNDTSAGTVSPRKRSIDEVYDDYDKTHTPNKGAVASALTAAQRDQLTCKAVVSEMFNSSWRLDTLYETALSEINLPATIFVRNAKTNKIEKYAGPLLPGTERSSGEQYNPDLKVLMRKPWPGALVESLPPTQPRLEAISYIIRNHKQRGKFKPEHAKALKVEMGWKWNQLSTGKNVLNEDGETITPDMVLGESKEGGGVAIVDLPDASYIDGLLRRSEWREQKVMAGVGAVIWICGPGVVMHESVQSFMRDFGHLEHIVSSPDVCTNIIALDSAAAATVRLRQIDPARYNVPVHDTKAQYQSLPDGVHVATRGQVVQLEPSMEVRTQQGVPPLSISATEAETSQEVLDEAAKVQEALKSSRNELRGWTSTLPLQAQNAEIVTLGTGSALPSKYRNVSATLLRVPGWGSMLFDCGENTLGQLRRVFPPKELQQLLRELRMIFISHMHADHHLGTVSVLKAWYEERHGSQPLPPDADLKSSFETQGGLAVVSEPAMQHWLSEYSQVEDFGLSRIAPLYITAAHLHKRMSRLGWFIPPAELAAMPTRDRIDRLNSNALPPSLLGLQDVQAVAVQHCHGARAVSVTFAPASQGEEPFKVSYSGDCRPSKAFSHIGKGSTVCIHEATFDDELQGDAEAKNHSTTSEALGVAQTMRARACVLTHFSQRYQKLPVLEHGSNGDGKVVTDALPTENRNGVIHELDIESANLEESLDGPLEDVTATFPNQQPGAEGEQHDLPSSSSRQVGNGTSSHRKEKSGPAAVKLKLNSDMKVCVAFDYMRVKVGEISQLEMFTPALLKLFAEEDKPEPAVEVESGKKRKEKKIKGQGRNV